MSAWFKRTEKGIQTATEEKKDTPKGLWYKSPTGKIVESDELAKNFYVSPEDDYHVRIGSKEYFEILFKKVLRSLSGCQKENRITRRR
jgi:acetyl-CoA carboxylase carboxyl transferase subunit beta